MLQAVRDEQHAAQAARPQQDRQHIRCVEQLHTPNWSVVRMERGFGGVGTVLDHKLLSLNSFRYQTVQPKQFVASNSLTEQFDASNC